jgi:hypothetical protein
MKIFLTVFLFCAGVSAQTFKEYPTLDRVEVTDNGHCQIRKANVLERNGVEISRSFHRWAFEPGGDFSVLDDEINKISDPTARAAFRADVQRV